jgi:hypothetical protein
MSIAPDWYNSLDNSRLEKLLGLRTNEVLASTAKQPKDERTQQATLMARKRAAARDIAIPIPLNPKRRIAALADPILFMTTYFGDVFFEAFTQDRRDMVRSIVDAALYGGDQAIAGPRGEGKTRNALYAALFLMLNRMSSFPVVIGKSQAKSQSELRSIKDKLQQAEIFAQDFPEIAIPFRAVGGWSSRARMQTVAGRNTNMEIAADRLIFPTIEPWQLPSNWPKEIEPVACGQIFSCVGIDGPIRGMVFRDRRPTIAIIDDIEDREAANSEAVIEKNEEILEQDIAGLGQSSERIPRVMLCTIQNRKCIAYRFTDPQAKPSWRGKRYRKMLKEPDRLDLVEQYIQMRQARKEDDPDAREAFRFWRDNQADLEEGCEISNSQSYSKKKHSDGEPLELSAIQAYYNRVADLGRKAVATEIDNDPPEEAGPVGSGLTVGIVKDRISGLERRQLPANTIALTAGIDLGKYRCYWSICAWWSGAGGCVVDYGVLEVTDTDRGMDNDASEPQIYKALLDWRDSQNRKQFVDATGTERKLDFVLVDSGTFTNAAYEFVRQVRGPYHVSKGMNPYHPRKQSTAGVLASEHLHAQKLETSNVWLYELDTSYWKQFVHERFLTPTFDENNMLRRGSLSLFSTTDGRTHNSFAHHIVAEELVTEFKEGKGTKTYWQVRNENNHWLDATYMAAAGSEVCGVRMIAPSEKELSPRQVQNGNDEAKAKARNNRTQVQHGRRIQGRAGGWIPKRRR